MARVSREDWFAGLKVGDTVSATLPETSGPALGTVESVGEMAPYSPGVRVRFVGREIPLDFDANGALFGHPDCLLWMVSRGRGNITIPAPPIEKVLPEAFPGTETRQ